MNKRLFTIFTAVLFAVSISVRAASVTPECEMRSTWIATVYMLDWPSSVITSTGNESGIKAQKRDLERMLDSLSANNFNAAKLQVRSRCDAFYKSSYEPWSSDLVSKRGMDPGYDPLEFFVEECHKRGMEAHAWVNPYRYETVIGAFSGTPQAYRDEHPDWLIDVGNASILNPALPEVKQRICDVVAEIVGNYDIDGLLFDDYFYLQGIQGQDSEQYESYKNSGGTLGINDWRRENINGMVRDVYATIKKIKPWVRFGIGPAGITCTSYEQADKHDVPVCTSGKDYQYNGIYSDPLAWLEDKSVDYISPQIYWAIGYPDADFDILTKWWSDRMPRYNRHLFISKDITALTAQSKVPDKFRASGEGVNTFDQYRRQVELMREYSTDGEPGSVYYRAKFIYSVAPKFGHFLRNTVYGRKALLPSMPWLAATPQNLVEGLALTGDKLTWTPVDGVRYAVFGHDGAERVVLGFTYQPEFSVPEKYAAPGKVSVAIYDRFGNVYSLRTLGSEINRLGVPALTTSEPGPVVEAPFDFVWNGVPGAESYILELSGDASMEKPIATRRVWGGTTLNSEDIENLPLGTTIYARVRALADNASGEPSKPVSFEAFRVSVTSPAEGDTIPTLTPTIAWNCSDRDMTVEVATDSQFKNIVVSGKVHGDSYAVPQYTLESNKKYYVHLRYERGGYECVTEAVRFVTPPVEEVVPAIKHPAQGGVLHADEYISVFPADGIRQVRVEVASAASFSTRTLYVTTAFVAPDFVDSKQGSEIKLGGKGLVDGQVYYVRTRGTYNLVNGGSSNTEYSETSTFTYSATDGGVGDVACDGRQTLAVVVSHGAATVEGLVAGRMTVCDPAGRIVADIEVAGGSQDISVPTAGLYIVRNGGRTVKFAVY